MCRAPLGNGVIAESVEEDSNFTDESNINEANYAMLAAAEVYEDIVRLML